MGVQAETSGGTIPILGARVLTPDDGEGIVTAVYYTQAVPDGRVLVMLDRPLRVGRAGLRWEREYEPIELVRV